MNQSAQTNLINRWKREEQQPFSGWDFSYLEGRMLEEEPPWSYMARAAALMDRASAVLDMDTGGGERLIELRPHWPDLVVASENYPPNVRLSAARLVPFGAHVLDFPAEDDCLIPFAGGVFDLILNRHSAFNPPELARTLKPDGVFLTQQVHGQWAYELLAAFDAKPEFPDATPERYVPWLERSGLTIVDVQEWRGKLEFLDVGAIVYYLIATPWTVPGFSVETHADYLLALQRQLDAGERLQFTAWMYLIEARKFTSAR